MQVLQVKSEVFIVCLKMSGIVVKFAFFARTLKLIIFLYICTLNSIKKWTKNTKHKTVYWKLGFFENNEQEPNSLSSTQTKHNGKDKLVLLWI